MQTGLRLCCYENGEVLPQVNPAGQPPPPDYLRESPSSS